MTQAPAQTQPVHEVRETLRPVDLPTEPLRITAPLRPRPAPPKQALTARPLPHDLDDYPVTVTPKTPDTPAPIAPYTPPGALLSRDRVFHPEVYGPVDRYDTHAAWAAFGEDPDKPSAPIPGQRRPSDYGSAA
ncbi:hypothetical protein [Streptacidiphilus cavernicola]|uniref:ATP-grasp-modified RiPP n=1 Tax=Streptacidiphilus cavernicola TaxID=3342716 RepID=A0ABV6VY12_9ACTN